jgi:hypothetical protein
LIDAILPLAFTMQANKGATAILLGSGVSRNAGIPTGWEVTLDLVKKLAVAKGDQEPTDPQAWYVEKFGKEPGYDEVLALVAPSAPQRHALVRGYFEPTPEESEEGLKQPTKAHRAIAELVSKGFVRVIVTTNFDRLMEQALDAVGIAPTVVTSADGIKGATPLPHIKCLVLKVHGDYHDNRFLNSPEELATYDPEMARYVARIAEDFGIVVAGWSGEYDVALSAALAEGRGRAAYPLYWCSRGKPGTRAQAFIGACKGTEIAVAGADEFFSDLLDKVTSLEALAGPRPMTTAVAVATAKRLIEAKEGGAIRLHDLVTGEARRVAEHLTKMAWVRPTSHSRAEGFERTTKEIEDTTRTLVHQFALGAYWSSHRSPFVQALATLGSLHIGAPGGGRLAWDFHLYPALLAYFAAGVASVLSGSFALFNALADCEVHGEYKGTAGSSLYPMAVVSQDLGRLWPGRQRAHTPGADRVLGVITPAMRDFAPNDDAVIKAFDQFEFIVAMKHVDNDKPGIAVDPADLKSIWFPVSAFVWRTRDKTRRGTGAGLGITDDVLDALDRHGANWGPLKAGYFGGDPGRANVAATNVDRIVASKPELFW